MGEDVKGRWLRDPSKIKVGDYIARVVPSQAWSPEIFRVIDTDKGVKCKMLWLNGKPYLDDHIYDMTHAFRYFQGGRSEMKRVSKVDLMWYRLKGCQL